MAFKCKILAIDGGGIRGIIPAFILSQLEKDLGKRTLEAFQVMSGTSTGGIITLALTSPRTFLDPPAPPPYTAAEVLDFYLEDEAELFVKQSSGDFTEAKYFATKPGNPPTGIQPWLQARLNPSLTLSAARKIMQSQFAAVPKQVLATCYTINGGATQGTEPYLFNWQDASQSQADDYFVWEAARSTSAAPTYFPVAEIGSGAPGGSTASHRWAVDGGVMANDPAVFGLAQARGLGLFDDLSEVLIVSLGTGLFNAAVSIGKDGDTGNWGSIQWGAGTDVDGHAISPLIDSLTTANELVPDAQLRSLLSGGSYFRLQPAITYAESALDGADTAALLATAKAYIAPGGAGYEAYQAVLAALKS